MKGWNRIARVLGALVLAAMACDLGNVPPGEPKDVEQAVAKITQELMDRIDGIFEIKKEEDED